jgi:hypothetical protein
MDVNRAKRVLSWLCVAQWHPVYARTCVWIRRQFTLWLLISRYVISRIELLIVCIALGYKRYIRISVKCIYRLRSLNRAKGFFSSSEPCETGVRHVVSPDMRRTHHVTVSYIERYQCGNVFWNMRRPCSSVATRHHLRKDSYLRSNRYKKI